MWSRRVSARMALVGIVLGAGLFLGSRGAESRAEELKDDPDYGATYARVRFLEGVMTLSRTTDGEIADATVNDPVIPGDRLITEDGRSEIGLSDGSTLWLDRGTRLSVRNLADLDNRYESTNLFALEVGAIRIDAPDQQDNNRVFRVDTEAGSVYLLSGGSFRIESDQGVTTLYSFRGVAELSGDDGSVLVRSGVRSSVESGRAPSEPRRFNTGLLDDFDRFCDERQDAYMRRGEDDTARVVEEVPEEVHPYVSELSYYGSWQQMPEYGWVWRPVYYGAWGPYVNGYWTWCRSGWVWVSYDPWGWAPYHYGRWDFAVGIGWIWIPGRVWNGAWVSFAVGPSYVGWCPLNYYNRPLFQDASIVNVVNVDIGRLQPRGWRFVPVEQFSNPRAARTVVRVDRLPRGSDVVLTSRLPRFTPKDMGGRPERGARFVEAVRQSRMPVPAKVGRDNKPLPFREAERTPALSRPARRGAPALVFPERQQSPFGRSQGRVDLPSAQSRRNAPESSSASPQAGRSGTSARERPRVRAAPSARQPGREQRLAPQPLPSSPGRTGAEPPGQGRAQGSPKRETVGDTTRRPGMDSDRVIERMIEGVRGERARPRVETPGTRPQRTIPPEVKSGSSERPPRGNAPPRKQEPKPKEDDNQDNRR